MNQKSTCRLCLRNEKQLLDIYSDTLIEGRAHEKILKFLYLDIKQDDILTKCVCLTCLKKVEEFHSFFVEVEQNQYKLNLQHGKFEIIFHSVDTAQTPIHETISLNEKDGTTKYQVLPKPTSPELNVSCYIDCERVQIETLPNIQNPKDITQLTETLNVLSDSGDSDSDSNGSLYLESSYYDDCKQSSDLNTPFPTELIKDAKLTIRGKNLFDLMSRFYKLKCEICPDKSDSKVYDKVSSLFNHYNDEHSVKGYVICCGSKLLNPRMLALHMARHLQPDAFQCPECGKIMSCPKILRYHIQNHLPEEKRPLPCPKCPRRFSYSSALTSHQTLHLPEDERDSHVCDECGKTFSSAGRLSKHMSVAHDSSQQQQFICHECGKQFSNKGNLSYHLTTHEQIHQVQCDLCGKWLKNKLCLRKHMTQHSSIRHNCTKCNYSAVNRQCLRNHMRIQHSNDKPFTCDECGRDFKLKNTLINHMVQHTGIKRFSCEFCTRQFASSGNYYSHRKRMHPTELAELNQKKQEEQRLQREQAFEKQKSCSILRNLLVTNA